MMLDIYERLFRIERSALPPAPFFPLNFFLTETEKVLQTQIFRFHKIARCLQSISNLQKKRFQVTTGQILRWTPMPGQPR